MSPKHHAELGFLDPCDQKCSVCASMTQELLPPRLAAPAAWVGCVAIDTIDACRALEIGHLHHAESSETEYAYTFPPHIAQVRTRLESSHAMCLILLSSKCLVV
eukprot:3286328-Amphidinium_carterae.2